MHLDPLLPPPACQPPLKRHALGSHTCHAQNVRQPGKCGNCLQLAILVRAAGRTVACSGAVMLHHEKR